MKPRVLYNMLNAAALLALLAATLIFGLGLFGSVVERRLRTDLFGTAALCFAVAHGLRALWDTGTRLARIEEAHRRLVREMESARKEHTTASCETCGCARF